MTRTLEEMDRELTELRSELEALKSRQKLEDPPVRRLAGCFTGDVDFLKIMDEIEAQRKIPDPTFSSQNDDVAA